MGHTHTLLRSFTRSIAALAIAVVAPDARAADEQATFWTTDEVRVAIGDFDGLDRAQVRRIVQRSMDAWNATGAGPMLSIDDDNVVDVAEHDGVNVLLFVDHGWGFDDEELGRTLSTSVERTGEIVDADIVMNVEHYDFSIDEVAASFDLQTVITHELGHLLGIRHLSDEEATMFIRIDAKTTEKRELSAADERALQDVYEGVELTSENGGCAQTTPSGAASMSVLALALVAVRRRASRA